MSSPNTLDINVLKADVEEQQLTVSGDMCTIGLSKEEFQEDTCVKIVANPQHSDAMLLNSPHSILKDNDQSSFRLKTFLGRVNHQRLEFQRTEPNNSEGKRGNKTKGLRRSPKTYTVQMFQRNLLQAMIAMNTTWFKRLLEKYNSCCNRSQILGITRGSFAREFHVDPTQSVFLDDGPSLVDRIVEYSSLFTLTHLAVLSGEVDFVRSCLDFGSAVHSYEDIDGVTALTLALWIRPEVAFEMLLQGRDVDVARVDKKGRNLVFHAVTLSTESSSWPQRLDFLKAVIERDKRTASVKDHFGFTPVKWALEHSKFFGSKEECMNIIEFLRHVDEMNQKDDSVQRKDLVMGYAEEVDNCGRLIKEEGGTRTTVHSETLLSDRIRLVLEGPMTRLSCIIILLLLHIVAYGFDSADRGVDSKYRDARWDFWFTVYNVITSCWNGSRFTMGVAHAICTFGGAIIGAFVYRFGVHILLGRIVMRLPMCGAQSGAEKMFMQNSFGGVYASFYDGNSRGEYFAKTIGGILGIYLGAKVYNALLYRYWPGQLSWALILPTIAGLDSVTALRGFWAGALAMDWYILTFVCDIMYQQGSLNAYLPHHTFGSFAAGMNAVLRTWKGRLVDKEIYAVRLGLYWTFLLFGWALIAAVFIFLESFSAPVKVLHENPFLQIESPWISLVVSSICIFLECTIVCQEWTWPTFQEHPFLNFPGGVISTHHVWFFILLVIVEVSLDMRMITAHIGFLKEQKSGLTVQETIFIAVGLLPAVLGIILLFVFILRSSLWWEKCGKVGRAIQLYSEHVHLMPCPLQSEKAAGLKKQVDEEFATQFSRTLACEADTRNAKEHRRLVKKQKKRKRCSDQQQQTLH